MPVFDVGTSLDTGLAGFNTVVPEVGSESAPSMTRDQYNSLAMRVYNRVNESDVGVSAWEHVGRWAAGTAIDLADTTWSSPLIPFGGERGDVWSMASDEQKEYYERHKGLIEGSSAVAGGLLTAVAAEALVIPRIAGALASSTALTGTGLWRATRAWNVMSKRNVMLAQRAAAESGEAFGLYSSKAGVAFATNRIAAGAAAVVRSEPISYAVMWNNESYNTGEWSREGFWIGAGAVLGGGLGAMSARATTRRIANSQEIRDLRHEQVNLSGVQNDMLSSDYLDRLADVDIQRARIKESAKLTELLLGSRATTPGGYDASPINASALNTMRDAYKNLATDSIQKIVSRGISGVDTYKMKVKEIPEANYIVNELSKKDPFLFHGMDEGGFIKGTIKSAQDERKAHIESLRKQADVEIKRGNQKEAMRLNRLQRILRQQDDFVLINGSWFKPDSEMAIGAAEHMPALAQGRVMNAKIGVGVSIDLPSKGKIRLDASLNPTDGRGGKIDVSKLTIKDRLFLDEAANSLLKKLGRKDSTEMFKLTDKAADSWYSLDLASELLDKGAKIQFDLKNMKLATVDDIKRHSLRIKAKALLQEVGPTGRISPEMRFKYNLPAPTAMEMLEDSAGDAFRQWLVLAAKDEGTVRELGQALVDSRVIAGIDLLPAGGEQLKRVDGEMFRFNRDKNGNWMRPMLGYFDQKSQIETISQRGHANAMTLRKAERTAMLMSSQTHVSKLSQDLARMPEFEQAMDIRGLHGDQVTGLGGGVGQAVSEVLPGRFLARDNPTVLAASKIQEAAERHGLATYKALMDSVGMQSIVTKITSTGHAATRAQLDQYASLRGGWDLEDGVVPTGDGFFGFLLKDTEKNRKRLSVGADEEWGHRLMQNERLGKPIVVNQDALDAINAFERIAMGEVLGADNTLRAAKGMQGVNRMTHFWPSPDTKGKFIGFVMDPAGQLVPGKTIVASSQAEYDTFVKRTLDELGPGSGHTISSKEQLESLRDVWDEAAMDWIDPGIHAATTGMGSQKGGLVGQYVKQGAFFEGLEWAKRKVVAQSQDTLRQMMEESLLTARVHNLAEKAMNKGQRTVFDVYEKNLLGFSAGFAETSIGDKALRGLEKALDSVLSQSAIAVPARHVVDLAQRIGMDPSDLRGKKTFKKIAEAMGDYTPFANADEFLESRGIAKPPTVKGITRQLNTMAATVLLRWFEVPHAAMNMLGIINTLPATVMSGKAPISTFVNVKGKTIGFTDGTKIVADGMKDMFTKRRLADWDYMVKHGDADQSVMEYHRALGAIDSQAGFNRFAKEIDKYISIASDKSERWSRQIAHFVGLRLADYQGIQGMAARHAFAREIANSTIADYAPVNRPELFSSGLGSMFGLFQSYALNHYTRMFRWMENGQYARAGLQAAMQATMFGASGTYGFGYLMDMRDSLLSSGSDPTAVDLIYEHFGPVLGGAIVHGGISEVSQLAMWTRGDTNFRVPGMSGTLAPLEIGTKVARGFTDGVAAYLNAMPGEGAHAMMEVVQREMPNRVLRSWLTLMNGGREIDAYGQMMSDTRTWMDTVARVVGLRSARQQSELEAYYAGKGAMERDAAKMEGLRKSFRSAVRNANGNMENVNPIQYFNDYVEAGGNPRMFKTWVRNLLRDADSTRAVKSLRGTMATPRSALETWRFGAYGAVAVE